MNTTPTPRTPKHHVLKCWPQYFQEVRAGRKAFECRLNDRDYREGDSIELREYDPDAKRYTGERWEGSIGYVLDHPPCGMDKWDGFAVLSLLPAHASPVEVKGLTEGELQALDFAEIIRHIKDKSDRDLKEHGSGHLSFDIGRCVDSLFTLEALCRRLLSASPVAPREWDENTIQDAPEGLYFLWDDESSYPKASKEFAVKWLNVGHYDRAFGPIPTPNQDSPNA